MVFSSEKGGVCHRECIGTGPDNLIISPDTLAVVRRGLEVGAEAASRLRLKQQGLQELRSALSAFVRHTRGREINSLLFLEQIMRPQ